MSSDLDEDDLFLAGLEILESRKSTSKKAHCYACGEQIKVGELLVCAECLSGECEDFEELTKKD